LKQKPTSKIFLKKISGQTPSRRGKEKDNQKKASQANSAEAEYNPRE